MRASGSRRAPAACSCSSCARRSRGSTPRGPCSVAPRRVWDESASCRCWSSRSAPASKTARRGRCSSLGRRASAIAPASRVPAQHGPARAAADAAARRRRSAAALGRARLARQRDRALVRALRGSLACGELRQSSRWRRRARRAVSSWPCACARFVRGWTSRSGARCSQRGTRRARRRSPTSPRAGSPSSARSACRSCRCGAGCAGLLPRTGPPARRAARGRLSARASAARRPR